MKGDIIILKYLAHENSLDVCKHFYINQNLELTLTDSKGQN